MKCDDNNIGEVAEIYSGYAFKSVIVIRKMSQQRK